MYSLKTVFHLILLIIISSEMAKSDTSLCDNPVITAADRMVNGTVRLYRDNQYWDLSGLPDKVGMLSKAYTVSYDHMSPITSKTSIMSCLICNRKGFVFKFKGRKWWAWQANGVQWKGGKDGEEFTHLPTDAKGFDVVFHNGKAAEPFMIGLIGKKVFYYSTKAYAIAPAPSYDPKGYPGGRFGENFPEGIDAAFSWPINDVKDGYLVYLFKGDKYCFRKEQPESGKQCKEWRENSELFGCGPSTKKPGAGADPNQPNTDSEEGGTPDGAVDVSLAAMEVLAATGAVSVSGSVDFSSNSVIDLTAMTEERESPPVSDVVVSDVNSTSDSAPSIVDVATGENTTSAERSPIVSESIVSVNDIVIAVTNDPNPIHTEEQPVGQTESVKPKEPVVAQPAKSQAIRAQKVVDLLSAFTLIIIFYFKLF